MLFDPAHAADDVGFRVAFIPEPSLALLQLAAVLSLGWLRRRSRGRG